MTYFTLQGFQRDSHGVTLRADGIPVGDEKPLDSSTVNILGRKTMLRTRCVSCTARSIYTTSVTYGVQDPEGESSNRCISVPFPPIARWRCPRDSRR